MTLPAQDIVERLRGIPINWVDLRLGNEAADRIEAQAHTISRLTADNEALRKTNEHWRRQSRDCFEAFSAMRDTINEVVPMQSAEADLLEGPEMFVSCEAVATAVISHVRATSARADALAQEVERLKAEKENLQGCHPDCPPSSRGYWT